MLCSPVKHSAFLAVLRFDGFFRAFLLYIPTILSWALRKSGPSIKSRVGGLILSTSSPHGEVSLTETLYPELLLMARPSTATVRVCVLRWIEGTFVKHCGWKVLFKSSPFTVLFVKYFFQSVCLAVCIYLQLSVCVHVCLGSCWGRDVIKKTKQNAIVDSRIWHSPINNTFYIHDQVHTFASR